MTCGIDMPDTAKDIIKWMAAWKKASSAIEDLKRKELRAPDYFEKNRRVLDVMLQYACDNRREKLSSGLVEQQRWFKKLRNRKAAGQ
jgi:hypothetical protein